MNKHSIIQYYVTTNLLDISSKFTSYDSFQQKLVFYTTAVEDSGNIYIKFSNMDCILKCERLVLSNFEF